MVTKNTSSFCTYTVFPPEYTPEWIKNTFLSQPTPLLRSSGQQWVDCWSIIMMGLVPSPLFLLLPLILLLPTQLLAQSRDSEPLVVTGEQVVFAENINLHVKIFSSFRWICLCLPISWLASVERQAPGFNCLYRWNLLSSEAAPFYISLSLGPSAPICNVGKLNQQHGCACTGNVSQFVYWFW